MQPIKNSPVSALIAPAVLAWQRQHGRHSLPWQSTDPYRVWLSEIMLQQTQVSTVLRYYPVFLQRFPDVFALAQAPQEAVLAAWSGLGYYSRARNLQHAAKIVVADYGGVFPATAKGLITLPGVGQSTANAIAAFCYQERVSILDANVQRVLARVLAFARDLTVASNMAAFWRMANRCLPQAPTDMSAYTQGLMDLGAQICHAKKPVCAQCPLQGQCTAYRQGNIQDYPRKKPRADKKTEAWHLLWLYDTANAKVYLERRAQSGIWGGLFAFPCFASNAELQTAASHWGVGANALQMAQNPAPIQHTLTHKRLYLHPVRIALAKPLSLAGPGCWVTLHSALTLGLPAPIRRYLQQENAFLN